MFYLIMDQMTCWGAGQTVAEAKEDACQWLCGENDLSSWQGISLDELEDMIVTEHESRNGAAGVFVYEVSDFDWPDNADSLDGDLWCDFYWAQEELNL